MTNDMTDRIEYETKTITVLTTDLPDARTRWTEKGWHVAYQNQPKSDGTITIYLQRTHHP